MKVQGEAKTTSNIIYNETKYFGRANISSEKISFLFFQHYYIPRPFPTTEPQTYSMI